ncbi:aminobenzoyl-glutamate transport protein [Actinomycetospora succinea]|uniref:Aminobenzoyl-glutamate transport protein n=1 Tax=Actinomycetospora succinea TaxID=663603 RepID=A0A4R6VI39_9PSEU|nr:AbgT family transporter [Actinomycetospora succinea]TDQ61140.1 aminobenzoyl-glutamate transport protein [Actinomycetospora succinea]
MATEAEAEPERLPGFLGFVERVGNRLPDPVLLFVLLGAALAVLSAILAAVGLEAQVPGAAAPTPVRSLLSGEGLRFALGSAIENFVEFPPLGTIIAVLLGIAVADRSGLLPTLLRVTVLRAPRRLVTPALMLTGVSGSVASDAAYMVLIPLGAMVFRTLGRSPAVGAVAAFIAVGAGYDASIFLTATDVLLAGITNRAAAIVDPTVELTALSNYWFSIASAIVVALAAAVVVDKVVEPRLGAVDSDSSADGDDADLSVSATETRGLKVAAVTFVVFLGVCALAWLPPGAPLRDPEGGGIIQSPFVSSIAVILLIGFTAVGIAYGLATGSITRAGDVPAMMRDGMGEVAPLLVLFFVIAQFLAWFSWTGIGQWLAVTGADGLRALGAPAPVLLVLSILLIFLLGLVITSGSAQWSLLAPVMVPMLLLVGIDAAASQAAFRIGDSIANVLTPMSPYFAVTLGFLQQYRRSAGIGTLVSMTLPIAMTMFVVWVVLFVVWIVLRLPLGV